MDHGLKVAIPYGLGILTALLGTVAGTQAGDGAVLLTSWLSFVGGMICGLAIMQRRAGQ